uniref:Poly [ADP-ribose] polymerase n=1 Tax=Salarias fasciatus TaxID=181472 RepID=A0A672IFT6_SALFA
PKWMLRWDLINKSIHKVLHNDLQDKEEAILALTVQWSIKDSKGAWQELSLHDNYKLEEANITKKTVVDVMAPTGMAVSVDVKKQEATDSQTGNKYQVKRIQSETGMPHTYSISTAARSHSPEMISVSSTPALVLPPHWEPMNDEIFKKVELQKQSQEYKDIEQGFKKTANYAIQKIERVQNVYLWHAFSVCKERIIKKNGLQNLGEKLLYHGTSAESCNCIERDRFDRNYAGAHAALYGKGVYFAVNAQYSASKYSPADKAGLKRLYAARVFTGRFTAGKSSMVAPPPRGTDPTDCYDSLVDKLVQPTMFVVFHDDQAYPEYLITFK